MASDKDFAVQQVVVPTAPPKPLLPTYLVIVEPIAGKAPEYFVATRFDEHTTHVKCVGFFSKLPEDNIVNDTVALLEKAPKEDYIESWFPWSRIIRVRSLVYRPRVAGK